MRPRLDRGAVLRLWLEGMRRKIARYCEDDGRGQRQVYGGRWCRRPTQRFVLQEAVVAKDPPGGSEGKQEGDEGIEVDCFAKTSV